MGEDVKRDKIERDTRYKSKENRKRTKRSDGVKERRERGEKRDKTDRGRQTCTYVTENSTNPIKHVIFFSYSTTFYTYEYLFPG
jgi:IS5 family transposase